MVERTYSNINQEIDIKKNINFYKSKNDINRIKWSKISILKRKNKPLFFQNNAQKRIALFQDKTRKSKSKK